MLGAASSTAAEGDVLLTERRYLGAAELFGQAADYVPSGHASERGKYLLRQAEALYRQGDERGDNAALRSAIDIYGHALAEYPRAQAPLDCVESATPRLFCVVAPGRNVCGAPNWPARWPNSGYGAVIRRKGRIGSGYQRSLDYDRRVDYRRLALCAFRQEVAPCVGALEACASTSGKHHFKPLIEPTTVAAPTSPVALGCCPTSPVALVSGRGRFRRFLKQPTSSASTPAPSAAPRRSERASCVKPTCRERSVHLLSPARPPSLATYRRE